MTGRPRKFDLKPPPRECATTKQYQKTTRKQHKPQTQKRDHKRNNIKIKQSSIPRNKHTQASFHNARPRTGPHPRRPDDRSRSSTTVRTSRNRFRCLRKKVPSDKARPRTRPHPPTPPNINVAHGRSAPGCEKKYHFCAPRAGAILINIDMGGLGGRTPSDCSSVDGTFFRRNRYLVSRCWVG